MTTIQALIIAIVQGITELFPISSLAHAVIIPALFHWHIDQRGPAFLPFLVTLHLGTAVALLVYFWRDWLALTRGVCGLDAPSEVRQSRHVTMLIILATIPAVVLGFLFEGILRRLFGTPQIVAVFLVLNGLLLLFGDRLRRGQETTVYRSIATLDWRDAIIIGLWQCLAFIPGFSRSGATIIGGTLRGIHHQSAARFSFLIGTPIIIAASVEEALHLHKAGVTVGSWIPELFAAVIAGGTAFMSTAFLMRYFQSHEKWAMSPFAAYCIIFGALSFVALYI